MDNDPMESELQKRCNIAAAKLKVAEELRWLIAVPVGIAAHLKFDSWWVTVTVGVVIFFAVTYFYEKEYDAANDAYERATGTGKYYGQAKVEDAA